MAYIDPTQDPSNQQNNPTQADQALGTGTGNNTGATQPNTPNAAPSTGGGGGGANAGGSSSPGSGNVGGTQASGTAVTGNMTATPAQSNANSGWTNLDQYLGANTDQASKMGSDIAGSVNQAGQQAQGDITNLGVNFNSAVNADTVNQDSGAVNQAISDAGSLKAGQTLSTTDQAAYGAQAGANYSGPTDATGFAGYNQAQTDTNAAQQSAGETQSEAGRDVLLNNQYANSSANGYNQGENNLDQLLLQDSAGGQAALQPLAQQWSGLNGALNNTVSTGNAAAANAATTDSATAAAAQGALGTANTNFQSQLNTGLANLQQTDTNSYNQIMAALSSGTVTPTELSALGVANPPGHIYGGTNSSGAPTGTIANSYITQGEAPTLQNFATADQYAQAQALAQLAGQSSSGFLAPGSASQAGTAETTPAYSFNAGKFSSDNASNQANYQTQVSSVLGNVNNGFSFGNINVHGAGAKNMGDAVTYLNNLIAWNGNGSEMANTEKAWAQNQLNVLNQAQTANGFSPYPVYSGPTVAYGQQIPDGWNTNQGPNTGGLSGPGGQLGTTLIGS